MLRDKKLTWSYLRSCSMGQVSSLVRLLPGQPQRGGSSHFETAAVSLHNSVIKMAAPCTQELTVKTQPCIKESPSHFVSLQETEH